MSRTHWLQRWFAPREWVASLADLGTFLPLALGVSLACGLDLAVIFIGAGLTCLAGAVLFRQPIPPQPMKAIAAIAIAGGIPAGAIAASGIWMSVFIFALILTGLVDRALKLVPRPVVIAIQVAVGFKLIRAAATAVLTGSGALGTGEPLPFLGWDSLLVAVIALVLLLVFRRFLFVLPIVFLAGITIAWLSGKLTGITLTPSIPTLELAKLNLGDWKSGFVDLAAVQLPLTLLNSVVAVCALSERYFPDRPVSPRRMAAGVAGMNLMLSPLGAMPMCFGSGGLAAQHYFGARTGGAPVVLGVLMLTTAILLGPSLASILIAYPTSILAVMLVPAGIALAKFVLEVRDLRSLWIIFPAVLIALSTNMLWGFLTAMTVSVILSASAGRETRTSKSFFARRRTEHPSTGTPFNGDTDV